MRLHPLLIASLRLTTLVEGIHNARRLQSTKDKSKGNIFQKGGGQQGGGQKGLKGTKGSKGGTSPAPTALASTQSGSITGSQGTSPAPTASAASQNGPVPGLLRVSPEPKTSPPPKAGGTKSDSKGITPAPTALTSTASTGVMNASREGGLPQARKSGGMSQSMGKIDKGGGKKGPPPGKGGPPPGKGGPSPGKGGPSPGKGGKNPMGTKGPIPSGPTPPPKSGSPVGTPTGTTSPVVASTCQSQAAAAISSAVPEVIARNPQGCCNFVGPTAFFVTHALGDNSTASGFEPLWNLIYLQILRTTQQAGVCFVMTGISMYDPCPPMGPMRPTSDILIDTNKVVASFPFVPAMMSTDPTDSIQLMQVIRNISNSADAPSIGVFQTGYNNIGIESILSGQDKLPFIGYLSEDDWGAAAATISTSLLNGTTAVPLCFNGRPDLAFLGVRCSTFYADLTSATIVPATGVPCGSNTTAQDVLNLIVAGNITVVWSTVECCSVVADGASLARAQGLRIVVGCQDLDTTGGGQVNFVTTQPINLQSFMASSWVNFPVIQSQEGKDGRSKQYFPSLQSLINTAIFNVAIA